MQTVQGEVDLEVRRVREMVAGTVQEEGEEGL